MFVWRNPVGIQSGPSRAPILNFWAPLLASRDPVRIQSGTNFRVFGTTFGPVGKQPKCPKSQKNVQKHCKNAVFMNLAASRQWCPTGSRLDPDWPKAVPKNAKIGARIHRSARTHSRTYFPLPRPTLALIFLFRAPAVHQYPPSCTKTAKAVLSQTGVLQCIYNTYTIYYIYIVPVNA